VIEDTPFGYGDLKTQFGEEIASAVVEVTADTRLTRKAREPEILATAIGCSSTALAVKLADMNDNLSDMEGFPDGWKRNYVAEKERLLSALKLNKNISKVPERLVSEVENTLERLLLVTTE